MKKARIKTMPEYFGRYIDLVEDIEVLSALEIYGAAYFYKEREQLQRLGKKVYAPGKWAVNDILQHLVDTERVFSCRALRFARHDGTALPGFDENLYAQTAGAAQRSLEDLLDEYDAQGKSTLALFKSFNEEQLLREGTASEKKVSVLALGFCIAGHAVHHMNVIKERYYPLIQ